MAITVKLGRWTAHPAHSNAIVVKEGVDIEFSSLCCARDTVSTWCRLTKKETPAALIRLLTTSQSSKSGHIVNKETKRVPDFVDPDPPPSPFAPRCRPSWYKGYATSIRASVSQGQCQHWLPISLWSLGREREANSPVSLMRTELRRWPTVHS